MPPDTLLNRARDTVPRVNCASPLTVRGLDIGIAAGQHDIAADGLDLDPLGRRRREVNIAAHIIGAQVPAASPLILPLTVRSSRAPWTAETFRSELTSEVETELFVGT